MDAERIKAQGPWVLVKPEPVAKTTKGGLFLPEGNLMERLGHVVGRVISVGKGHYVTSPSGKQKFVTSGVAAGDRVIFRGHLKEANTVARTGACFMHMQDLIGRLEEGVDLDLALPYDN